MAKLTLNNKWQRFGLGLAAAVLAASALPVGAAVHAAAPAQTEIPPAYQLAAENDYYEMYVDKTLLSFKLLDKRNGYLWHSGIDETAEGDRLNKSWRAFAQSGISIEYLDEKAVSKRVSLANSPHTLTVTPIDNGISADLTFQDYGISLRVLMQLEETGIRIEIPAESVRQDDPAFKLGLVYIHPFMGATRGGSTPGYMLLPDGTGSLVRFADSTKAKNIFYGRYYGTDLGIIAKMPYDRRIVQPYPISFPVFGVTHGEKQNAFLTVIEKGASYAELQVHPAGILTNFNFIYNAFIYNQSYFQATNRSGAGVTTVQRQTNSFDVVMHYRFLTDEAADYVGMAHSYQRYLLDAGLLNRAEQPNPDIGIRLEFLGGDKENVLFWQRFIPMTTVSQMETILDDLQLPNPEVVYYGWQPLGATNVPPTSLKVENGLGSVKELNDLSEKIQTEGGHFSLYLDPQAALWEESGYSPRNDLAMAITNVNIEGYNRSYNYYFSREALERRYNELSGDIAERLNTGLALDSIGWLLYSDFRGDTPYSREAALSVYRQILSETPLRLGLYRPNDYLWSVTQAYYDIPLGDNGYIYTSEAVPFLPIVLAGYIPYYGPALNFSSNLSQDLLRQVDYGIYPSFFLTQEATANMLNTASTWIYTSSYNQWGSQVQQTYQWMNALLAPVRGRGIIDRVKLAEGVFATRYDNQLEIVVNYTSSPFEYNGISVPAADAVLVESVP